MKIFISWSGERSRTVAEFLRYWIPEVIQAVQPWMSAEDIDPGVRWSAEIAGELEASKFGIICLTPENITTPWILFEAGALAKTLDSTFVCPYLIDLEPTDLKNPLIQFQAAKADRDGTLSLLRSINQVVGTTILPEDRLKRAFERWWPDLEEVLNNLPKYECGPEEPSFPDKHKGLESVFLTRGAALDAFTDFLKAELEKARCGEQARIWIVSSSLRGFIMAASDNFDGQKIIERVATSDCDFRILMTDPQMADLRAKQEGRRKGDIQAEIRAGIAFLENRGVKRESVKYYPGTPTVFAIATMNKMLLNPYPYESESQRCFSLIVNKTLNPEGIYHQYIEYHFDRPWKRAKEIPLEYWSEDAIQRKKQQNISKKTRLDSVVTKVKRRSRRSGKQGTKKQ
jgi:hypothetical protein